MKKTTITISFDEEKLSALKMYLEQSKRTAEEELEKALETLYQKTVPAGVREFLDMKSGTGNAQPAKTKKAKPIPLSAVGAKDAEASMGKV